jgi:hypothetical protein
MVLPSQLSILSLISRSIGVNPLESRRLREQRESYLSTTVVIILKFHSCDGTHSDHAQSCHPAMGLENWSSIDRVMWNSFICMCNTKADKMGNSSWDCRYSNGSVVCNTRIHFLGAICGQVGVTWNCFRLSQTFDESWTVTTCSRPKA